jgi:hypothetical protein
MFYALMAIDGRQINLIESDSDQFLLLGIFKNNQAQVDEYLAVLNPLLRRTTEGILKII